MDMVRLWVAHSSQLKVFVCLTNREVYYGELSLDFVHYLDNKAWKPECAAEVPFPTRSRNDFEVDKAV